jgi:hypothetical protein
LALLLVVCFVTGAVAEDRLKWSGAYRARAWYNDNSNDFDNDNKADRNYYIDQRFRIQMSLAIAEGISGVVRMDLAEVTWGLNTTGSRSWARPDDTNDADAAFQLDRTYVRIDKEMFTLNVGQQFMVLGGSNPVLWDANQFGANLRIKLPVDLYGQYAKISESGSRNDEAFNNSEDVDFFGGMAKYSQESWSVGVMAAMINDNSTADASPYAFGFFGDATFGALSLEGEADFFGGDFGPRDYFGSQVWIAGKYAITPAFWLGLDGWYAAGKNDVNKIQATTIIDGADTWSMTDKGPFKSDILTLGGAGLPEFDPAGASAGAVGGVVSAGYRIVEPLLAEGSLLYVAPETTRNTTLNSIFTANIFLTYDWYQNTQVSGGFVYQSADFDGISTDPAYVGVLRLMLKF